jgi:rsbT co-antagonist protein RsbR
MWKQFSIWLHDVHLNDPIEQHQAPALQVYMLAFIGAATLWSALPFLIGGTPVALAFGVAAPVIAIICHIVGVFLLRRGFFERAVLLSVVSLIVGATLILIPWGLRGGLNIFVVYMLAFAQAGVLVGRRGMLVVAFSCIGMAILATVAELFMPGLIGFAPLQGPILVLNVGTFVLCMFILIALYAQFGSSVRLLLNTSMVRERELDQLRNSLEQTVADRTTSLQGALATVEQRETQLQQTLHELQASSAAIEALSAPVIPVLPGILVAPLVGVIDSARTVILAQSVLSSVEKQRAHVVIFDITGIPLVDTHVAQAIIQTAQAIRLLGADVALVGIRPEVAQTLVSLNIPLAEITTYSDLQGAILSYLQPNHANG